MWYSTLKNKIDSFAFKSNKSYAFILFSLIASLAITYLLQMRHGIFFIIYAIVFCILTVVVTMKFTFNSKPLSFVGKHVFSIYILQRLFFNLGQHYSLNEMPYLFFSLSIIATIFLAIIYDYIFEKCKCRLLK